MTFPDVSAARMLPSQQDLIRLMAPSDLLGLAPETFYELFPFRE